MIELSFPESAFQALRSKVLSDNREACAVALARHEYHVGQSRLLVQEIAFPAPAQYLKQNTARASLEPAFVAVMAKRAATGSLCLVFVHSHPFDQGVPAFSSIDDDGERELAAFLARRELKGPHLALVISPGGLSCRELGVNIPARVTSIGSTRTTFGGHKSLTPIEGRFDRQQRFLGIDAQQTLAQLRVAVVGLGGTGSIVCQQLAFLGVSSLTLIDSDVIEESNLNRVAGAARGDVGRRKVDVAADHARAIFPEINAISIYGDVTRKSVASHLLACDLILSCTDSHASRGVLNQLAYQYFIPCIDMGVSLVTGRADGIRISGRVQLLSPGISCLTCQNLIDPAQARIEIMSPEQRAADPYFIGPGEPQPAVISINSTIASLATTMFLAVVAGLPSKPRHLLYDGVAGRVRPAIADPFPACVVCSRSGAFGRGSTWPLPTVDDENGPGRSN